MREQLTTRGTPTAGRGMGAIAATVAIMLETAFAAFSSPAGARPDAAADAAWAADSLYQVDVPLETASGAKTTFSAASAHVRIVSMFYASCAAACPLTVDTLRRIEAALTSTERARLGILLVSLDPQHDDPAALREFAGQRRIQDARWVLGRASETDTRKLASALDVRYRELADGNFNHSTVLVLLDVAGRVLARSSTMGTPDPEFLAAIRKALRDA